MDLPKLLLDIFKLFAGEGGVVGLVMLGLLCMLAYHVYNQNKTIQVLLEMLQENRRLTESSDERLLDLKTVLFQQHVIPNRRRQSINVPQHLDKRNTRYDD